MHNLLRVPCALLLLASFTSFSPNSKTAVVTTVFENADFLPITSVIPPPTFTNCPPSDISQTYTPGTCGAMVTWTPPTASPDAVSVTSNYSPGDSFLPGTTAVIYRAENAGGEVATCSFNVTVDDDENPVFNTFPGDVVLTADPNTCTAGHSWAEPIASDNCPAGEGSAPVLQDFENTLNQCFTFSRSTIGNGGEINGTRNLVANSLSSMQIFTSSLTTPVFYLNGFGEITFSHRISAVANSAAIHLDVLDENGNLVTPDFFTEVYTTTAVQQEIIPISLTGNFQLRIRYSSSRAFGGGQQAYLDDFLIPGTIITNINDPDCELANYVTFRSDGTGLNNGDQFDVGTTTIEYTVRDASGNFTERSFNITVENDVDPPSGTDEYFYCEGENPPTMTVNVDTANGETANWYDGFGNLVASDTTTFTAPASSEFYRNYLVYAQNANGCSSEDFLSIDLYQIPLPPTPSAPSPIEYCVGDSASPLTATGEPGNTIRWYDAATGGTMYPSAPTPNTSIAGTTSYFVEQEDASTGCYSNRAQVDVIVHPLPLEPTLTTPIEYCIGDTAAELDSHASGTNLKWYTAASGGTEIPGTTRPDTSTAGQQFFWATQTAMSGSANCESTRTRLTVNVNTPPVISVQPVDRSVCDSENVTFAVTASDTASFQWQLFDGIAWNDLSDASPYSNTGTDTMTIIGATVALNGNQYRAVASSSASSCPDAISDMATLTVNTAPAAPTSGGDQTECELNPVQTLTATANPPSGASVVWYDSASGGSVVTNPILDTVGTATYYAQSNDSGNGCPSVVRTPVTLTIQSAPAAPISGGDQIECEQSPIQTLTATATAPSGATVVWYDAPSGGNLVPSPTLNSVATTTYYAQSNDDATGCPSTSRTPVTLTIQPAPAPPVSGGDQTECEASPTQTLTATVTVPSGFTITWFDAASGGSTVGSPTLNSVGTITYYAESGNDGTSCESTSRTPVTLTIEAVPAAPASGGDQTECEASPTQTMTAAATAPAGANVIWYDAASGGNTVGSPTLNSVGSITYYAESRTTSTGCISNNRTPVTLTMYARPSITVTPASESCSPDLSTYSVSVDVDRGSVTSSEGTVTDNGGNNWTISGVTTGNNITVTVTDANSCAENISINAPDCSCPTVNAPTSGGDQTECESDPIQTLTAVATPPSGASVVWYDAATNGNMVASPTLGTAGAVTYYAESVDNVNSCASSTRTPVTLTIQAAPVAPTSGGDQTECEATPIQTLTATVTSAVGSNVIWYDAPSGGNTVASPTLNSIGTITYYAESRDNGTNCASHSRTPVTLTIQPNPAAPTSGGDQTECETSPVQTLTASASAPAGSSLVWYDAASGGNTVGSPTLNSVGTVTYYAESRDNTTSCASFSRTPVTLTVRDTPDIAIASGPTCAPDLLTYEVSVSVSEGTVTSTEGTVTDNGGNNWTISGVPSGNDITLTVTAPNACAETLAVTAPDCSCPVVNAPTSGGDQAECEESPIQTLTAAAIPPSGADVMWYDAATGGNLIPSPTLSSVGTIIYFAESRDQVTNCTSDTRTPVQLTIQRTPPDPVSGGDQTECDANPTQTLIATATCSAGANIVWYDAAFGGNLVASPILDTVGSVTYFAESRDNTTSCTSFNRVPVTLTIHALPNVSANATATTINAGEPVTLTGSGAHSYLWDNGVNDGDTVFPMTTTTYTVTGTDTNGCENTDSVTIIVGATSDIRLEKTVDNAFPNIGDTVTFTLTAINDGPSDDTGGTIVNDVLPGGYTYAGDTANAGNGTYNNTSGDWTLPALTNGNSVSITISAIVNAPTGGGNDYLNVAQVISATNFDNDSTPNNNDGDQSEDDEAAVSITPQVADLEITNSISQASANPGDALTLTVDVINNGPNDATNVCIENTVPDGLTVTTINNSGSQTGNIILWSGVDIPNGETITLTFGATVNFPMNTPNEYLNTVQITTVDQFDVDSTPNNDDGDQSEDDEDNTLLILQSVDLEVTNSVTPDSGNPGDILTFTVEVRNTGTDDATNTDIENVVPSGFTVTAVNNGGTQSGNLITWNGLNIPNGTMEVLTFAVSINVPTNTPGEYFNTVQVTDVDQLDSDSTPNNDDGDQSEDDEDNADIVLIPADLSLTKALTAASNQNPNAGDTVTFELTLTNAGPGLATNVTVEDQIPSGLTVGAINNGGVQNGNTIIWSISSLSVGSEVFTYDATINVPTNVLGEYTNTAQIMTSDQFDPDSTPNNDDGNQSEDDETSYTINAPTVDIELAKTIDKSQTFHGDTVVFTITATNNSLYDATNVGIEDVLPNGYTLVSHTATLGAYNETIATWDIESIAIGETATLEMTVTVTEVEDYTNIAELIYVDQIDPNIANDRAEATPEITQAQCLTVFNEFSPNDDGANDFFFIECIENYPNSLLRVYNRWGSEVFAAKGYDNTWDGTSTNRSTIGTSEKLPVGTYYYTLAPGNGNAPAKSGWLYISR